MDAQQDALIGTLVAGRFRVQEVLGEGGMGVVYLARHELIEKSVALKVLRHQYSMKSELVTRFQQEAISASRIKHPNVLDIFDFGQLENGCFFLAMEHLSGHDLGAELADFRVIDPRRGTYVGIQMCRALAAAHARGVVHRDMKPENVFLHRTDEGEEIVKIVDFGIAQLRTSETSGESQPRRKRLTRTGMIFGTPEYMAPEQASGTNADLRIDVYAVGIILYEMFTGTVPFSGNSFMAVLASHANDPLRPMADMYPEVEASVQLREVISKTLQKAPAARFQSMGELARALLDTPEGQSLGLHQQPPIPIVGPAQFVPSHTPVDDRTANHCVEHATVAAPEDLAQRRDGPITAIAGTPEAAATMSESTARRSRRGLLVAIFAVGGVAIAIALTAGLTLPRPELAHSSAGAPRAVPPAPARHTDSTRPMRESSVGSQATAALTPSASTEAKPEQRVRLEINTTPEGATIFKDGFQVCDYSPCHVLVPRDESTVIEARLGAQVGSRKVLAQHDQTVKFSLKPAKKSPSKERPAPTPKLCEVDADGLKILRPCR